MISFTICSNNYLAEAITLGNSLVANNCEPASFIIFLVDKKSKEIDYSSIPFKVVPITELVVPSFTDICSYYDIVELNTAVKPSVFKYLFNQYSTEILFAYLDPDLYFLQNIEGSVKQEIGNSSILLTPHLLKPTCLNIIPFENTFLNYGIYNLGFIALKADANSLELLNWWEERTLKLGVDNVKDGFFVDQLWLNLAPIFFKNVKVSLNPGLNAAYWNLNEREIKDINDVLYVNNTSQLIFFHFSSFDMSLEKISKRRYSNPIWDTRSIKKIMETYKERLETNNYSFYKKIAPYYSITSENLIKRRFSEQMDRKKVLRIQKIARYVPERIINKFLNLAHILSVLKEEKI